MSVGYIEVTNGQDRYVVRRTRKSIQEPMSDELIRGRLANVGLTVEVQDSEIKKEIKNHFSWAPATSPNEVVKNIDPQRIQISEYSYTNDSISYGIFDSAALAALTERCAISFLPDQPLRFVGLWRPIVTTATSINGRSDCPVVKLYSLWNPIQLVSKLF